MFWAQNVVGGGDLGGGDRERPELTAAVIRRSSFEVNRAADDKRRMFGLVSREIFLPLTPGV